MGIYFRQIFFFLFSKLIYKINLFSFFLQILYLFDSLVSDIGFATQSHIIEFVQIEASSKIPNILRDTQTWVLEEKKIHLSLCLSSLKVRSPFKIWISGCAQLYIPSTLNIDLILWHTQLIVCAVKC